MEVIVKKSKCIGCGVCTDICQEGIEIKNGKAEIVDEEARCLEEAVRACPHEAIVTKNQENRLKEEKEEDRPKRSISKKEKGKKEGVSKGKRGTKRKGKKNKRRKDKGKRH